MWGLPGPGIEPMSPAWADGFSTTEPAGRPHSCSFWERSAGIMALGWRACCALSRAASALKQCPHLIRPVFLLLQWGQAALFVPWQPVGVGVGDAPLAVQEHLQPSVVCGSFSSGAGLSCQRLKENAGWASGTGFSMRILFEIKRNPGGSQGSLGG